MCTNVCMGYVCDRVSRVLDTRVLWWTLNSGRNVMHGVMHYSHIQDVSWGVYFLARGMVVWKSDIDADFTTMRPFHQNFHSNGSFSRIIFTERRYGFDMISWIPIRFSCITWQSSSFFFSYSMLAFSYFCYPHQAFIHIRDSEAPYVNIVAAATVSDSAAIST